MVKPLHFIFRYDILINALYIRISGHLARLFMHKLLHFILGYGILINALYVWVWRRLVARYLGVVEAAGSNPVTQTK